MTEPVISLGRETPYKLQYLSSTKQLLAVYADAVVLYEQEKNGGYIPAAEAEVPSLAAAVVSSGDQDWKVVLAGSGSLSVLNQQLELLHRVSHPDEEDTQSLLVLDSDSFLSTSDVSTVTCWTCPSSGAPTPAHRWPVECRPLWASSNGKTVICVERGRLQERDPLNGTVIRTWPKSPPVQWATGDKSGQHLLCVDETGQAWLWDAGARECLFSLTAEFPVARGVFTESGLGGALLGAEGELATFRVVEGGVTTSISTPESVIVALTYSHNQLLQGMDENGGLWSLNQDQPESQGGKWAGWATSTLHLAGDSILVGTANGSIELFRGTTHVDSIQVHTDAVIGLEAHEDGILSVGADATVVRLEWTGEAIGSGVALFQSPGRFVVDYVYCKQSQRLCLALDEGLLTWFRLENPEESDELQLEERRIEELNYAGSDGVLALTDRGSVKHITLQT